MDISTLTKDELIALRDKVGEEVTSKLNAYQDSLNYFHTFQVGSFCVERIEVYTNETITAYFCNNEYDLRFRVTIDIDEATWVVDSWGWSGWSYHFVGEEFNSKIMEAKSYIGKVEEYLEIISTQSYVMPLKEATKYYREKFSQIRAEYTTVNSYHSDINSAIAEREKAEKEAVIENFFKPDTIYLLQKSISFGRDYMNSLIYEGPTRTGKYKIAYGSQFSTKRTITKDDLIYLYSHLNKPVLDWGFNEENTEIKFKSPGYSTLTIHAYNEAEDKYEILNSTFKSAFPKIEISVEEYRDLLKNR